MNKNMVMTVIITLIVGILLLISSMKDKVFTKVNTYYQVYLNGNVVGVIDKKEELYKKINDSQTEIKETYGVDNVYPPTDLKIIETNTYNSKLNSVDEVYKKIEEDDNFAIKGYTVTIKSDSNTSKIYVLNKDIFTNATKKFVRAFLNQDEYDKYINDSQAEIVDTGRVIENMNFKENISIKESFLSVNDKIYTNEHDLVNLLLFGEDPDSEEYIVEVGDTIESISTKNELNTEEFLYANTKYKSKDAVLRVGDTVNVTLINPKLTFVYKVKERYDETEYFEKEKKEDNTKYVGWSEITTPGINGISRYEEEYTVENGVRSQGANPIKIAVIKEAQNQVTTYGSKKKPYTGPSNIINPVILDGFWAWPTNKGYVITSNYGYRWGKLHRGIDVSGAGNFGSPIYSAGAGVVTYVLNTCPSKGRGYGDPCGGEKGNQVWIDHGNGYVTKYAHLHQTVNVSVGQTVGRGTRIGSMGNSGSSTGNHLHFEVIYNGTNLNPLSIYR